MLMPQPTYSLAGFLSLRGSNIMYEKQPSFQSGVSAAPQNMQQRMPVLPRMSRARSELADVV